MTKYLIKLLLFIILGLLAVPFLGSCQVKPNEFIEETAPTNSNFEMYSQKNGINRRASLANLKKYFTPYIYGTIAYVPSASGNASNRMEFVVDPNGDSWYIDAGGVGTKLGKSYTAGTGIGISGSVISNTGLLPTASFGGDVSGTYDDLQIGASKVGVTELIPTGTSAGSFSAPTISIGPDGRIYSASAGTSGGDLSGPLGNLQIVPNAVGSTELAANSVTTAKIGAAQVTMDKIAQAGASSGQAIAWNGTAWAPATISGGGGGGTPAGSNGQIQFNNAGAFGASANLFWSGTNLGIGNSSPSALIDVLSNAASTMKIKTTSTASGNIFSALITEISTGSCYWGKTGIGYNLGGNLTPSDAFVLNSTGRFVVDNSNGNIVLRATNRNYTFTPSGLGIGTASPTYLIDCAEAKAGEQVIRVQNPSTATGNVYAGFRVENSTGQGLLFKLGTGYVPYKNLNAGDLGFYSTGAGNISILNDYPTGNISMSAGGATNPHLFVTYTGRLGIGSVAPTAKLFLIGEGQTSATNTFLFVNAGNQNVLSGKDDGTITASFYPNTRNDAGSPVNVFSSSSAGILESHTAAELVAAGGGVTANIATGNLTSTGSHTLTLGNNTLTFDASTSTNTISQALIFKGKSDGINSAQPFTFQDAGGSQLAYLYQNNLGISLSGITGKNATLGSGTYGWTAHNLGVFVHPALTSNPSTTGIPAAEWFNSTTNRWMFRINGDLKTVATLQDDLAGTLTTYATDPTPGGASYGVIVDAFTVGRTVTLGADLNEGRFYTIKARRNTSNTITVNAASGYTLEIDKDASIGPTTFNMAVGETILAQRFGTVILVKR